MKTSKRLLCLALVLLFAVLAFYGCATTPVLSPEEELVVEAILSRYSTTSSDVRFISGSYITPENSSDLAIIYCKLEVYSTSHNYIIRIHSENDIEFSRATTSAVVKPLYEKTDKLNPENINGALYPNLYKSAQNRKTMLIVGGGVLLLAIIGLVVWLLSPKQKEKFAQWKANRTERKRKEEEELQRIIEKNRIEAEKRWEERKAELAMQKETEPVVAQPQEPQHARPWLVPFFNALGVITIILFAILSLVLGFGDLGLSPIVTFLVFFLSPLTGAPYFAISKIIDLLDQIRINTAPDKNFDIDNR